jgi:DNA-binding NarL/FixJ family response regulator
MSIGVLLADDHAVVRDGLKALLEAEADLSVLGAAADGDAAVKEARRLKPDVVIMDISMPGLDGVEATRHILQALPATRILMLSMHGSSDHVLRALQAGARGYLLKESAGAEVVAAVRAVHAGRRYLSEKIADTAIDDFIATHHTASPLESLSAREREILQLIANGHSNPETARLLSLSVKTVETYRSRLMQKLGIDNLPALVKFAIEHGLTQLE